MSVSRETADFWRGVRGLTIGFATILVMLLLVSVISWWLSFTKLQAEASRDWAHACTEPLECVRKDLVAQQRVADSTAANVHISLLGMLLNTIAAAFVGATLIYTVRSTRAATAAAEAAQRGLELTEDNTQREIRAYVIAKLEPTPLAPAIGEMLRVPIRIRNCGSTPAYQVKTFVNVQILEDDKPIYSRDLHDPDDVSSILGPGESFSIWTPGEHEITAEDIAGLRAGRRVVLYSGRVTYVDVFGQNQWLIFSARFIGHPLDVWWDAENSSS